MRRVAILFVIFIVLIGAGFLSISLSQSSGGTMPGVRVQTDNPDASVLMATPQKAALLIGLVVVTIGGIGGLGTGLALLIQVLSHSIKTVEQSTGEPFAFDLTTTRPRSLGYIASRRPAITVGATVIVLFVLAAAAAGLGILT